MPSCRILSTGKPSLGSTPQRLPISPNVAVSYIYCTSTFGIQFTRIVRFADAYRALRRVLALKAVKQAPMSLTIAAAIARLLGQDDGLVAGHRIGALDSGFLERARLKDCRKRLGRSSARKERGYGDSTGFVPESSLVRQVKEEYRSKRRGSPTTSGDS